MRYGTSLAIAGEFSGSLSNDGEQLTIAGGGSNPIIDLTYNDADPWPASADGDGYSLVLIDPASGPDPSDPMTWRTSATTGGNPGSTDRLSYPDWKFANGVPDDEGDPEGDGLSFFMEYALGGHPFLASPEVARDAKIGAIDVGGVIDTYLMVEMHRRLGTDDVSARAELSPDLVSWHSGAPAVVPHSVINNNDGTETVTYRSVSPVVGGTRMFARAQFTLKP